MTTSKPVTFSLSSDRDSDRDSDLVLSQFCAMLKIISMQTSQLVNLHRQIAEMETDIQILSEQTSEQISILTYGYIIFQSRVLTARGEI